MRFSTKRPLRHVSTITRSAAGQNCQIEQLEGRTLLSAGVTPIPGTDVPAAGVFTAHSTVNGQTLGQWGAAWWQWALKTPVDQNPLTDPTGARAAVGQSGPVFFIGGDSGPGDHGATVRTIVMPTGKRLFFPIINVADINVAGFPTETASQLQSEVDPLIPTVSGMTATIDGVAIPNLTAHREPSSPGGELFNFPMPDNNLFGVPGQLSTGISDGYYLMVRPLDPGWHTIAWAGNFGAFGSVENVTYHIDVLPQGQYDHVLTAAPAAPTAASPSSSKASDLLHGKDVLGLKSDV